jgi:hypothetical protein
MATNFHSTALQGQSLKPTDMTLLHGATSDPYLIMLQKGKPISKTKVIDHSLEPDWGRQTVVMKPNVPIEIQCWDHDALKQDDKIGSVVVPFGVFMQDGVHALLAEDGSDAGKVAVSEMTVVESEQGRVAMTFASTWGKIRTFAGIYVYLPLLVTMSASLTVASKFLLRSVPVCPCECVPPARARTHTHRSGTHTYMQARAGARVGARAHTDTPHTHMSKVWG